MASTTSDGSERESPNPSEQNGDGSESGLRAADDQEPAVKMDAIGEEQSPDGATRGDDGDTEAEKEQEKSPGSAEETAEPVKTEQREEENACSPADKSANGGGAMKRRASLELSSSSDGEPLSRMDSEDRCVMTPDFNKHHKLKVRQTLIVGVQNATHYYTAAHPHRVRPVSLIALYLIVVFIPLLLCALIHKNDKQFNIYL